MTHNLDLFRTRGLRIITAEKYNVKLDLVSRGLRITIAEKLNVRPDLVSRGSRITNAEKLNVRPDLVSGGSRITNAEKLNVRPDLVSTGSRIIIAELRLTSYQQVKPKIMRTESCIERITVSTLQTLYRGCLGILQSE